MWTTLLAFAGGVLAVALKGYVDLLLERRRERRVLDVAARLVYEELWAASSELLGELTTSDYLHADSFAWNAWDEHETMIAGTLEFELWRHVSVGYDAVRDGRAIAEAAQRAGRLLTPSELRTLDDLKHSIGSARGIVAELIKGIEWEPYPADDDETERQSKRMEQRRRRSRLWRKLLVRARDPRGYWAYLRNERAHRKRVRRGDAP